MQSRQLAQVGLGLIGVWALLAAVEEFVGVIMAIGSGGAAVLTVLIPIVLLFGLSYVLVFHNAQLATAIVPDADVSSEHTAPDLARILIVLAGIMLLGQGIPSAVNGILNVVVLASGGLQGQPVGLPLFRFIGSGAQVAFAIYLIARPARLLEYTRPRGAEQSA